MATKKDKKPASKPAPPKPPAPAKPVHRIGKPSNPFLASRPTPKMRPGQSPRK